MDDAQAVALDARAARSQAVATRARVALAAATIVGLDRVT
jgi:hypothetical protein